MRWLPIVVVISACATTPEVVHKSSAPEQPAWVTTTPNDQAFLYFVGVASQVDLLAAGKDAALSSATNQVAQYIGVNVSALGKFVESTTAANRMAEDRVTTATTGTIQGAEIAGTYYESSTRQIGETQISHFDVWTLVRFPRAAADSERARQAKEQQNRAAHALDLLGQARGARTAGKLTDALRCLRDAKGELAAIPATIDVKSTEFRSSAELAKAVEECLADTQAASRRTAIVATETLLGSSNGKSVAAESLAGVLARKGFPVLTTGADAAISIQITSSVVRTSTLYGSPVCTAHVQAQATDNTSHVVLATAETGGKGVKPNETIAAQVALAEAGEAAGNAITKALLEHEQAHQ